MSGRIFIFGAGMYGIAFGKYIIENGGELLGYVDNKKNKTPLMIAGKSVSVFRPSEIDINSFYKIYIAIEAKNQRDEIRCQLENLGVRDENISDLMEDKELFVKVFSSFNVYEDYAWDRRIDFVRDYSDIVRDKGYCGAIAECGVFRGDFTHYLCEYFPDNKIYLFDTFEGFDKNDLEIEKGLDNAAFNDSPSNSTEAFSSTEIEIVQSKLTRPERVEIRKGYFPDTAEGVDDRFLFVSLDMDLYKPMLAGLKFFYPRMIRGGIILCHDYYSSRYSGVKKAFSEFSKEKDIIAIPVGDGYSYAIVKEETLDKGRHVLS